MKPPICCICHSPAGKDGGLVKFSDYTPLPPKMVGHPHGLAWCCGKHLSAAGALVHLSMADAIAKISL
ncbi:MAG: hypothetical protein AAFO06_17940 [Cyanobacteria bacterium J06597_16]